MKAGEITSISLKADTEIPTLYANTSSLSARYIEATDIENIANLAPQSYPEGLPADVRKWSQKLVNCRAGGNYYSCLVVKDSTDTPLAAIGFGQMPILNYDPKHGYS